MTFLNIVITGACDSVGQHQHGVLDVLVDESADERDTVIGVFPREELVGASCNSN